MGVELAQRAEPSVLALRDPGCSGDESEALCEAGTWNGCAQVFRDPVGTGAAVSIKRHDQARPSPQQICLPWHSFPVGVRTLHMTSLGDSRLAGRRATSLWKVLFHGIQRSALATSARGEPATPITSPPAGHVGLTAHGSADVNVRPTPSHTPILTRLPHRVTALIADPWISAPAHDFPRTRHHRLSTAPQRLRVSRASAQGRPRRRAWHCPPHEPRPLFALGGSSQ